MILKILVFSVKELVKQIELQKFPVKFNLVERFLKPEMKSVSKSYVFELNKMMFDNLNIKKNELCCFNLKIEQPQLLTVPKYGKKMIKKKLKNLNILN